MMRFKQFAKTINLWIRNSSTKWVIFPIAMAFGLALLPFEATAGLYYERTQAIGAQATLIQRYYDAEDSDVMYADCIAFANKYGYISCARDFYYYGKFLTETGWLCALGPQGCNPVPPGWNAPFLYDWQGVRCDSGRYVPTKDRCYPVIDIDRHSKPPPSCGYGNPIFPLLGVKRETIPLNATIGALPLVLTYDTTPMAPIDPGARRPASPAPLALGGLWTSNLHRRIQVQAGNKGVLAWRGDGRVISFYGNGSGAYTVDPDTNDRLVSSGDGWVYIDSRAGAEETYDSQGKLTAIAWASGARVALTYSTSGTPTSIAPASGYLINATDRFGRVIEFTYYLPAGASASTGGLVNAVRLNSVTIATLGHDANGNLSTLSWADGMERQFLYGDTVSPWALTGIVDELQTQYAIFSYDGAGRAISTEHIGGVNKYSVTYAVPPKVQVTDVFDETRQVILRYHEWMAPQGTSVSTPTGANIDVGATTILGSTYPSSHSQPAGSGCAASTSNLSFDANGNREVEDDFSTNRTCRAHDLSRNLETARIEGLANAAVCSSVMASTSGLPAGSRKTSTQWHPDWRMATKVAEPKRLTTSVYNGQPDPFNGGAIASCAPSTALLPDGKPIVVLCKQVEQATTDADGSTGFSASLDASVPARVQQWTYNQYGQVLTAKDALNHTTTNTYYSDTTADHTLGDPATVTNALNQVVANYTQYNPAGQWLQMVDANGTTTTRTFDLRQRLKTSTMAGATTSYDYWPTGLLKTVTLPDASFVNYGYDDAHRLTSVTDSLGNSITYTLDNAGNVTAQAVKDPSGMLSRTLTQSFDALGRVQQTVGRQ